VFLLGYILADRAGLFPRPTPRSLAFGAPPVVHSEVLSQMALSLFIVLLLVLLINRVVWRLWRRRAPGLLSLVLIVALWRVSWSALEITVGAQEILLTAAVPIIAVTLLTFGEIMLIMRTTMIDTQHEDFVRAARAKGLSEGAVRDRHAARIALLPVVSRLVISLPYLMAGVVMIEQTTGWSGMGSMLFYAVGQQNAPLMTGTALAIGAFSLVARIILDMVYVYLDPRVYSGAQFSRRYL
jgi:peptide/nickel transport system permease protein